MSGRTYDDNDARTRALISICMMKGASVGGRRYDYGRIEKRMRNEQIKRALMSALTASAVGGIASSALNDWDLKSGLVGAGLSGAGTLALNLID